MLYDIIKVQLWAVNKNTEVDVMKKKMPIWALLVCGLVSIVVLAVGIKFGIIAGKTAFSTTLTEDVKGIQLQEKSIKVIIEIDDFVPDWAPATPDAEMTEEQKKEYRKTICDGYFKKMNLSGYTHYYVGADSDGYRYVVAQYDSFADAVVDIFANLIVSDIRHVRLIHIDYYYEPQNFTNLSV